MRILLYPTSLKKLFAATKELAKDGKCALPLNHVFGKKYDYICEKSIVFTNPDAKAIECIKKLIELRRNAIKEGNAKKHKYIPIKDRE